MGLPNQMRDIRSLLDSIDPQQIEDLIAQEARAQIAIIGPVNAGKSTLFNQLQGQQMSRVSAVPGTTTEAISERFGPFWLVDTPGFDEIAGSARALTAGQALDGSNVAVLVLDAMAGIRQADKDLLDQVRARGLPVVVVLNKLDLVGKDADRAVRDAERKLGLPVIGISAKKGTNIAEQFIPALIDAHPRMAVSVGRALPRYRRRAARRIIRDSSLLAMAIGAEPVPGLAVPFLIAIQVRMLLRLAAVYGEGWNVSRARELISAAAGGFAIRYAAQELAKLLPAIGWAAAGFAYLTGTAALGNVAIVFFENQGKLQAEELRSLYKRFRRQRKDTEAELISDESAG